MTKSLMIDTKNRLAQLFSIVTVVHGFGKLCEIIERLQAEGLDFGIPAEAGCEVIQDALVALVDEGVVGCYYPDAAPSYYACWQPCDLDPTFWSYRARILDAVRRNPVTSKRRVLDRKTLVTIIGLLGGTQSVGQLQAILYLLGYGCDFRTLDNGHLWSQEVGDMLWSLVDEGWLDERVTAGGLCGYALTAASQQALATFGAAEVDIDRTCLLRDTPVDVVIQAATVSSAVIQLLERLR